MKLVFHSLSGAAFANGALVTGPLEFSKKSLKKDGGAGTDLCRASWVAASVLTLDACPSIQSPQPPSEGGFINPNNVGKDMGQGK